MRIRLLTCTALLLALAAPLAAQRIATPGPHATLVIAAPPLLSKRATLPVASLSTSLPRASGERIIIGAVLGAVAGLVTCTAISNVIEEEGGFHTCAAKGNVLFGVGGAAVGALAAHLTRE